MALEAAECKTCEYCAYRSQNNCIHTNENQLSIITVLPTQDLRKPYGYQWYWNTCDKWVNRHGV